MKAATASESSTNHVLGILRISPHMLAFRWVFGDLLLLEDLDLRKSSGFSFHLAMKGTVESCFRGHRVN